MHMHTECAREYISLFSTHCATCKSRVWRVGLEARPTETEADKRLCKQQLTLRRQNEHRMLDKMRRWRSNVWPAAARTFVESPRDTYVALVHLSALDTATSFRQRFMDRGGDGQVADAVVSEFAWFCANYTDLAPRVRRALRRNIRHAYDNETSDDEP